MIYQKKLIDLDGAHNESLDNLITDDYVLDFIFDDISLIEFIDEEIEELSQMALEDPSTATNPSILSKEDFKKLYEHSLEGKLF